MKSFIINGVTHDNGSNAKKTGQQRRGRACAGARMYAHLYYENVACSVVCCLYYYYYNFKIIIIIRG